MISSDDGSTSNITGIQTLAPTSGFEGTARHKYIVQSQQCFFYQDLGGDERICKDFAQVRLQVSAPALLLANPVSFWYSINFINSLSHYLNIYTFYHFQVSIKVSPV